MKSNTKKKKKLLAAAAALALIAAVAGTFAWISAQDQRINRVKTAAVNDGSVTVQETWVPKPIVAGTSATKEVTVTNSGNVPVFVRVSYEEVFTHLHSKGVIASSSTAYDATAWTFNDDVPVDFDGDKYTNSANPSYDANFADISSQVTLAGGVALPSTVKVYGKGSITVDPVSSTEHTEFSYAMFYVYTEDGETKYQAMDQTVTVVGGNTGTNPISSWTFEAAALGYRVYEDGYDTIVKSWAKSSLPNADGNSTGYALLDTEGTKYGTAYDYTVGGTLDIAAMPGYTPQTLANVANVLADRDASFGNSGINLKYSTDLVAASTLTAWSTGHVSENKWVYNEEDGYFYYTSPVASGASTGNLLEELVFGNAVDKTYTNATYDLIVKMEAVQATAEALTDSAGWGLTGGTTTTAIVDYLSPQEAG